MRLARLDVRRLPGLETPFPLEPAPGLTIVHGSNGSGKSSVCRAILGLLFPDGAVDAASAVRAVFARGERILHASREAAGTTRWTEDGDEVDPQIPAGPLVGAYRLGLLDLHHRAADRNEDDRLLTQEIRSRLAGGFDVEGLLESDELWIPARPIQNADLKIARERVEEIRVRQARIARDEDDRLPELSREIERCDAARRTLLALQAARQLQAADRRRAAAEARLRELPVQLPRLLGNEDERLDGIERRLAAADEARGAATAALTVARQALAACGFPSGPPDPQRLAVARKHLEAARDAARDLARRQEDLAGAERELAERAAHLLPGWPADRARVVMPAELREAEELLRRSAGAAARAEELSRLLARPEFADLDAGTSATAGVEVAFLLARWLAAGAAGDRAALVLAGIAAVAAVGLGAVLFAGGDPLAGGWSLAAGAVALGAAIRLGLRDRARAAARRRLQREFAATGQELPAAWTEAAVRDRFAGLVDHLAAQRHADLRRRWRDELAGEAERERRRRAESESRGRELGEAAGLAGNAGPIELVEFLRRVGEYHDAGVAAAGAAARARTADDRRAAALAEAGAILAECGVAGDLALPAAEAALVDLESRAARAREEMAAITAQGQRLAEATVRRDTEAAERARLFRELELAEGDRASLLALVERHAEFTQVRAELDAAIQLRAAAEVEVAGLDPVLGDLALQAAATSIDAIDREAAEAARQIARAPALHEEKGGIERELAQARGGAELEAALAARERARESERARREQARRNALARLLLQDVADEFRSATLPGVVERARLLFATFTRGAWQVSARRDGTLVATDTARQREHELDELSDGTRAQLLLAARLAFIEDLERGEPLPLLLDEALTAADPHRFRAIAEALAALVDGGRQVIVFTADPGVIGAWRDLLAELDATPARVLDLDAIGGRAALAPAAVRRPVALAPLPDPTLPPEQYAERLQAPRLDLHAEPTAAHLWHLLWDDQPALDSLLRLGLRTWGALASLAVPLRAAGDLDEPLFDRLQARARALQAFLSARRRGRGLPVTRDVLSEVPRIGVKLDELAELAESCGGDARLLVAAVHGPHRIAGVGERLEVRLREHLASVGCLDDRHPADRQEILAVVLEASAGGLAATELAALVDRWWQLTEPPARPAAAER